MCTVPGTLCRNEKHKSDYCKIRDRRKRFLVIVYILVTINH